MDAQNNQKPKIARTIVWLVAFFAAGIASAWDMHAKPGGWTEVAIDTYVLTFMFGSAFWQFVSVLKADRAKQLAERFRLKAVNDENLHTPPKTPAQ